jgi:hypothetical protein
LRKESKSASCGVWLKPADSSHIFGTADTPLALSILL